MSLVVLLAFGTVLFAGPLVAGDENLELRTVSASIRSNGKVEYQVTVHLSWRSTPNPYTLDLSGTVIYDPAAQEAQEELRTESGVGKIHSTAHCLADPWLTGMACTNGSAQASWNTAVVSNFGKPITASGMSAGDRDKVRAAFEQAWAQKKAADEAAAAAAARAAADKFGTARGALGERIAKPTGKDHSAAANLFTPTPTPTFAKALDGVVSGRSGGFHPTPTKTPVYPPYGAEYIAGVATVKPNQLVTVPVSVKNLSSQTWPANGVYRLSYHWVQGANAVVWDGDRTSLPSALAPGGAIALSARLKGPPAAGTYTLKWDMVQENVTWFSTKGVPTKDQSVSVAP